MSQNEYLTDSLWLLCPLSRPMGHSWKDRRKMRCNITLDTHQIFLVHQTDIKDYTQKDIEMIQFMVNSTPRKCLGYETPEEAFIHKLNGALEI
jgi:hypothetical protein